MASSNRGSGRHRRLLEPGRIGALELRNRIVMPAMDQNACTGSGLITDAVVAHYEERARGGVGLLILETSAVAYPVGATSRHQPSLSGDDCIPGLRRLAEAVHTHGAAMVVQICHHGKVARVDTQEGRDHLVASTPVPSPYPDLESITGGELARIMAVQGGQRPTARAATPADLDEVVEGFAAAARRVQAAGLDGVEIHGGHGYLISAFLSPLYNKRQDEYGGTPENRARLLTRVVSAIRHACGPRFALLVRLDGCEYDPGGQSSGGIDPALAACYAALAEAAGADAVHVSASSTNSMSVGFTDGPLPWQPGQYLGLARTVKAGVGIPVIAVGRLDPDRAEAALASGDTCDFVAMGRQLLADPELPHRLEAGRPDLVRSCISCFVCVAENFWDASPVCAVNPRLGHYDRVAPVAPARSRKVIVVGGGPAGLEAARVAAGRGHRVILMERGRLGGTARLSALTTPANGELVRYLEAAIVDAGVEVRLGVRADLDVVGAEAPDVVVVASGARRGRPAIPGSDLPHVLSGDDLRRLLDPEAGGHDEGGATPVGRRSQRWLIGLGRRTGLLDDPASMRRLARIWMPIGRRVAVIGGGLVGAELAGFLADRGRTVSLLEESPYIGAEMALPRRMRAVHELVEAGVRIERRVVVTAIDRLGVTFRPADSSTGWRSVRADTVIYAAGVQPDLSLAEALAAAGYETHPAGDCAEVGYIQGAIHSGAAVGEKI